MLRDHAPEGLGQLGLSVLLDRLPVTFRPTGAVSIAMPFPDDRRTNYTQALAKTEQCFPGTISSAVGQTLSTLVGRPNSTCREYKASCRLSSWRRKDTFQYR